MNRAFPLTVLNGGINRLRVKGGASANQLYDLQNAYITNAGSIVPREGTVRTVTLDSSTVGLAAANGQFNIFSSAFSTATLPAKYVLNVLSNPNNTSSSPIKIWFAKPFMGFEYVVAEFSSGDVVHYWLQNNGTWTSSTDYTSSSIVLPPVVNGLAYQGVRDFPVQPLWTPDTVITSGAYVEPNSPTGFAYQAIAVAPQPPDPFVTLLLHCDGAAGSASFPDSSGNNIAVTANGAAAVETSNVQFGTGAFGGNGADATLSATITTNGLLDIYTGNQDFTAECWFNDTGSASAFLVLIDMTGVSFGAGYRISISEITPGKISATRFGGSTVNVVHQTTITTATWHHVALVRHGTALNLYLDGVQDNNATTVVNNGGQSPGSMFIGKAVNNTGFLTGFIDEVRVTNGFAQYTANFTPTGPFLGASTLVGAHTGAAEPPWPTVAGGVVQEFGDFDVSTSDAGTTQATNSPYSTASPLGVNITDRYGNSATIANSGIFSTSNSTLSSLTLATTKVTTWAAGTNYAPGAVVVPSSQQGAFVNAIPNGDFEGGSGVGGWTFTGTTLWGFSTALPYQGSECISIPGGSGIGAGGSLATMTSYSLVSPGQSVTASAYVNPNNNGANLTVWIQLNWYDSSDSLISSSGNQQNEQEGFGYRKASVTASAPVGAAHVRVAIGAGSGTNSRNAGFADLVSWNLETAAPITNFLFEAIQPTAGSSAATEPSWPTVLGATIVDGTVTWKAIGTSIITWQAIPLMQSGLTAPTFPTVIGNTVSDFSTFSNQNGYITSFCSMSWECVDRHVADPNCPNTKAVAIGASHVFAGSNDIVDYSAAVNPIDWTSTNNAGYLPTGLNNYGDNPVAALALYRGNLIAFNAGGYQMWQIDPDPQNMALLDAQPVGSLWPRAAQSVANDLLFLTEIGVRNLGTVGATANMAIGDTGQAVDPLVQAQITSATYDPFSIYYPARGQYWLIYGPQVFVLTINGRSQKSWSRYIFPQALTDATLNEGALYLRTTGNLVWQLYGPQSTVTAVGIDDAPVSSGSSIPFNGVLQWPYLDLSSLGVNKMLVGIDIVGEGNCSVQIAFNQNDKSTFNDNANFATSTGVTTPYFVQVDDTVPGEPIAIPINAPSYSPILTFTGSSTSANAWSWQAMNIYFAPAPSNAAGASG